MRMLFTFVGGRGHFEPLAPIARLATAAGHSIAFGCATSMLPAVEAEGLPAVPIGSEPGRSPERLPLQPLDSEREERDLRERFVQRAARYRVPLAIALCEEWRPDVVVCDETDFGVMIAAERLGLPYATVQVIAAGSFVRPEVVGDVLQALRSEHGLPPDARLEMLSRYLVLSPVPPSFRDPTVPLPNTAHSLRPSSGSDEFMRPAAAGQPTRTPTVYFTLGTIFNLESGDLFSRVLAGLRELSIQLVVTVGQGIDPAEFGSQPANVRIEQYIPQSQVLPGCDLVVSHAGSGSVIGALAHGLPSLLIPMGADQPENARRCVELGVGTALDALSASAADVREAASELLVDASYRRNAERIRDEIAALPDLGRAVELLEELAIEKQPLHA